MWSLGVIAFILLSGIPPFNGSTDAEIMGAIRKGKFNFSHKVWVGVSESAKDFITKMLTLDTQKRPTAEQAMQHKWIAEFSKQVVDTSLTKEAMGNLQNFHKNATLKVATLSFISSHLTTKQEREDLARIFKLIDKNGDGRLSKDEVQEGYMALYGKLVSDAEVNRMFDSVDTDQSGYIEYSEFVMATINEKKLLSIDRLQAAFKMFDKDNSGNITPAEIKSVLSADSNIPADVMKSIMQQVDENGDGEISL